MAAAVGTTDNLKPGLKPKRPVLRYHGGKWMLAPWVISHFPAHQIYVEPYCGAASVLLRKQRSRMEVINDLDGDIVNVFRVLRDPDQANRLRQLVQLTPFAWEEFQLSYQPATDAVERARRTLVRAFMGYGSDGATRGCKTGFRSRGFRHGGTPADDWANYPQHIKSFVEQLKGVEIQHKPALDVMRHYDRPEALFYLDPPYVTSTRSSRTDGRKNYTHEMLDTDHRELADALRDCKGMVVLSGYDCDLYAELFRDWHKVTKSAMADGAKARVECLWISPNAAVGLQGRLF